MGLMEMLPVFSHRTTKMNRSKVSDKVPASVSSFPSTVSLNYERKFNVVVFGAPECLKGTP